MRRNIHEENISQKIFIQDILKNKIHKKTYIADHCTLINHDIIFIFVGSYKGEFR